MRVSGHESGVLYFLLGAVALLYTSCNDGIGLLTRDERESLYSASITARGSTAAATPRNQGTALDPTEGLRLSFQTVTGSAEPAELDFALKDAAGRTALSFLFYTPEASEPQTEEGTTALAVSSLASFEYTVTLPEDVADGYYEIILNAKTTAGDLLSHSGISLFLIREPLPAPSILAYPANPTPGARVLLVANLEGYKGLDPYLRWTVDGSVRAEGTVSEGKDHLLWPAPLSGSAAPVSLAVYPVAPPAGVVYSFPPPRSASISLLVASSSAAQPDEFAEADRFLALFRMEDTAEYAGREPGMGEFIGTPRLAVNPGGFGLTMGGEDSSGVRTNSILLPIQGGELRPFSILARLVPEEPATGSLFLAGSDSTGLSLEVRLEDGRPRLILRSGEKEASLEADTFLPSGRSSFLAVSVCPEGAALRVRFVVDGKESGGGILPWGASGWAGAVGSTRIAGPGGCPGLYDEIGVWAYDPQGEPAMYPAFLFAAQREFAHGLILANGFDGTYEEAPSLSMGASVSALEGLKLPPGAEAVFSVSLEAPFQVRVVFGAGEGGLLCLTDSRGSSYVPLEALSAQTDTFSGYPLVSALVESADSGVRVSVNGKTVSEVAGLGLWRVGLAGAESGTATVRSLLIVRPEEDSGE